MSLLLTELKDTDSVAICLPDEEESDMPGRMIGSQKLFAISPEESHHRQTDFGIHLLPEYQGKGYGTEAIDWLLMIGFQNAGLHRISAVYSANNLKAAKSYEKLYDF
jgi:RimJ/RimL family protein N-acetyltransferase